MSMTTADFVALSDLVYNPLPNPNDVLRVNGKTFQVLKTSDPQSPTDYQGMVILDVDDPRLLRRRPWRRPFAACCASRRA
jgi:hypothetical protein